MGTFDHLQRKSGINSTPAAPTSSFLGPSRPFALVPTLASGQVPPAMQVAHGQTARFDHSFARIPLFPPTSQDTAESKANQITAIDAQSQTPLLSAPSEPDQRAHEATSSHEQSIRGHLPRLGYAFASIPLFPSTQQTSPLTDQPPAGNQEASQLQKNTQMFSQLLQSRDIPHHFFVGDKPYKNKSLPDLATLQKNPQLVLGDSQPHTDDWKYPEVVLNRANKEVSFRQTPAAATRNITSLVTEVGKMALGPYFMFSDNNTTLGNGTVHFSNIHLPSKVSHTTLSDEKNSYTVHYEITEVAHRQIADGEEDHLRDFEYAFSLSLKRVEEDINRLASKAYKIDEKAITALVTALEKDALQLIPKDPQDLASWETRLKYVASELAGMSAQRDTLEHHTVKGYDATISGQEITLVPRLVNPRPAANTIIKLTKIPSVYNPLSSLDEIVQFLQNLGELEPKTLISGSKAEVKEAIEVNLYKSEEKARSQVVDYEVDTDTLSAKTIVSVVESNVAPGKTLVSFDVSAKSGVIKSAFEASPNGQLYTEVPTNQLVEYKSSFEDIIGELGALTFS